MRGLTRTDQVWRDLNTIRIESGDIFYLGILTFVLDDEETDCLFKIKVNSERKYNFALVKKIL